MVPSVTAPGLAYGQSLDTLLLEAAQVEKGQRQAQRSPAAVGGIEMVPPRHRLLPSAHQTPLPPTRPEPPACSLYQSARRRQSCLPTFPNPACWTGPHGRMAPEPG